MLFRKQNAEVRCIKNLNPVIFLPLVIAIIIALTACAPTKGGIVILENPNGTGFTMEFKEYSARNKCELSLNRDDEIQIEITRESGEIALTVSGKNGSEPYAGNGLESGIFTVTVSETDEYVIGITGKRATGEITVKKSGSSR
jgi:hypothetical protein